MSDLVEDAPGTEGRRTTSRWSLLVLRWRRFRGRLNWGPLLLIAVAVFVGFLFGRTTAPDPTALAAREIDARLMSLALDAEGIWTSAGDAREPVNEAFVRFRREGDPSLVEEHHEEWQAAYDAVLVQLAGLPLSPPARPVQRQYIAAITLSRDAIDVLAHAATVEDEELRQDLLTEVGRLRQRSEQLTQSARASLLDLDGQRADVSPLGRLPSFMEGRR